MHEQILAYLAKRTYQPLKPKDLAKRLGFGANQYQEFRKVLKELAKDGRLVFGKNHNIQPARPHGTVTGTYRRTSTGSGFVRPQPTEGLAGKDILIRQGNALDASGGDEVLVRITSKGKGPLGPVGEVVRVVARAAHRFVGNYFVRDGQAYVRVDGTVFSHSLLVGDPGAKGAKPNDQVVIEMVRFPSAGDRGEAVIVEVLGAHGEPGVDTLSIIRQFDIPDVFPEDALEEARRAAMAFSEEDLQGRRDLRSEVIITIDPVDARDFDDAISLSQDSRSRHWSLGVHIADVSHFAQPGGALDREARKRGTSVYLPQRVIPMFPELISNSLASLQQGRMRFVKSVFLDYTALGQRAHVQFAEAAICVRRRFSYEEVSKILADPEGAKADVEPEVLDLLLRMRELSRILRKRRMKRGALQLDMPEVQLEYDEAGQVTGAHQAHHDESHQIIEDFMLAANDAVAEHLHDRKIAFLRRIHPSPDPLKLEAFADFARGFGYQIGKTLDRYTLQKVLEKSAAEPHAQAVHFALLRSLKQAQYSPVEDGHYALASDHYCHFTSPIRRYPDLTVHRLIAQLLATRRAGSDVQELLTLGDHCSKTERRAEMAERELIKVKLLRYMSERIGMETNALITGVADYGFFAQAEALPVEGMVHVSTLPDDYYYFDQASHSLQGRRTKRTFRLGDRVRVQVVRVDIPRRQLDFRIVPTRKEPMQKPGTKKHKFDESIN